jgi:hypothetical protein
MANRPTDSHTHKGVVSLVMLIAHSVKRRILAALVSPGRTTMMQFTLEYQGNGGSRQDDAPRTPRSGSRLWHGDCFISCHLR